MSNKLRIQGENPYLKKKINPTQKLQESDLQKRDIRWLQMIYQTNLNKFLRKNKDCFNGTIQVPPNKPFYTPQQYQLNKKVLQNFDIYSQRLIKSMLIKNQYLQKQHSSYEQVYRQLYLNSSLQNPQQGYLKQSNQKQIPIYLQNSKTWQNQINESKRQNKSPIVQRPFSATITPKIVSSMTMKSSLQRKNYTRPFTSHIISRQTQKRPILNLNNINIHKVKIEKDRKNKVPLFRQSLGDVYQYEKYQEEEVYIRKKIVSQINNHQKNIPINGFIRSTSFFSKKLDTNNGQSQKLVKNLNQHVSFLQRQRLKNKIMTLNTVLAFNLNQTQGYKPKSKVWSNPFT